MNKYQLVNGKWAVTKTAQTYDTPGFWESIGNAFTFAGDKTALNNLNLKEATRLMNYVYGPSPFGGWGPWGEALEKFKKNLELGNPYTLICLDIMLPNKDGQAVLKEIRKIEDDRGIVTLNRAKIVMVTSLGDSENVTTAFREQCEAYIIKPIIKNDLVQILKNIGLIS